MSLLIELYGIIVAWGGAYSASLNTLQMLQNKITKIIDPDRVFALNIHECFTLQSLTYYYD